MSNTLTFRSAARTHPGRVRSINEDALLARDDACVWLIADGMGGHANGQWASRTLVNHFAALGLDGNLNDRVSALTAALQLGNDEIAAAATAAGKTMGTTLVLMQACDAELICVWIGDSRLYRLRQGVLTLLTRDHTVVQDLIDQNLLAEAEAETHPMSHVLNRAVGVGANLAHDGFRDEILADDGYLLCSDGLSKAVPAEVIAECLAQRTPETAAERLVDETLQRGAPDNVSVIVIAVAASGEAE